MTNRRVTLAAGLILPIVHAGCVAGYNSLLFTTKTNVGLVVDTKPPEVSLDIGRQELLFAPTYEEGKTPPVMASFRFESEKMFNNYLGSAFATGDASVAMSRLYDAGDWPDAKGDGVWSIDAEKWRDKERLFDSSVALTMAPKYPSFVPREKPGQVRPVLFGTDTSFGFKASWSGMESAFPDYVRLAYQRRELAFAAVTIGPDKDDDGNITGLKARTPSLLATVDAKMQVGKFLDTNLEYLQYFASGRAATALAMRKPVREAMLRRLDPESAPDGLGKAFEGSGAVPARGALVAMYDMLGAVADDPRYDAATRAQARRVVAKLNQLATEVPTHYPVRRYFQVDPLSPCFWVPAEFEVGAEVNRDPGQEFRAVTAYWDHLDSSLSMLRSMLTLPENVELRLVGNASECVSQELPEVSDVPEGSEEARTDVEAEEGEAGTEAEVQGAEGEAGAEPEGEAGAEPEGEAGAEPEGEAGAEPVGEAGAEPEVGEEEGEAVGETGEDVGQLSRSRLAWERGEVSEELESLLTALAGKQDVWRELKKASSQVLWKRDN